MKKLSLANLFSKLQGVLFCCLIFLLPSNLFLVLSEQNAFVSGLRIDYLLPKFFLSDIVVLGILILEIPRLLPNLKQYLQFPKQWQLPLIIGLLFGAYFIKQLLSPNPMASLWYLLKLLEMVALTVVITRRKLFRYPWVVPSIALSIVFQSVLGMYQFITQHSVAGYWFLGEVTMSRSIGLAKATWQGRELILPYGTTAHPNILAGILAVYSLFLMRMRPSRPLSYLSILLGVLVIVLSGSVSASLILLTAAAMYVLGRKLGDSNSAAKIIFYGYLLLIPLSIFFISTQSTNASITRRAYLQSAAVDMILSNPHTGVGLNTFVQEVEQYGEFKEVVRFVQPVHHVGLLFLAESGWLGVVLLGFCIYLVSRKKRSTSELWLWLAVLAPVLSLDHYLYTQQSGLLLVVLVISFAHTHSAKERRLVKG
ncbi:MAG: O-antigen ligase family protein [bacterium]|nr:O-antigen ligase family protein [bacterium]